MLSAIADTHAIIWYIFADSRLSQAARAAIEVARSLGEPIGFSSITFAEIIYLTEKDRIPRGTLQRLTAAATGDSVVLREVPFDLPIALAMMQIDRAQVPDLPDRIISATALFHNLPLITRDHKIQATTLTCIW